MNTSIEHSIKLFASLPNARIDRSYGQGKDAVAEQMLEFSMIDSLFSPDVEEFFALSKRKMSKLKKMVTPYELPKEYIDFLENYGGLCLVDQHDVPVFTLAGVGAGIDHWYGDIVEVNREATNIRQLRIGSWDRPISTVRPNGKPLSPRFERFGFYVDLAGDIEKDNILTAGPWDYRNPEKEWKILAHSFSEWLAKIAEAGGPMIENS